MLYSNATKDSDNVEVEGVMDKGIVASIVMSLIIGVLVGYVPMQLENGNLRKQIQVLQKFFDIPQNVTKIAKKMHIVIVESETENRTVYLDPNQSYCQVIVFRGGSNPFSGDLAYPNASIVFFFLEDIEDPDKADNYSDLIIRMNPIIGKGDGKLKMVVVFFAEGGYEKFVYYNNELLHHYNDEDPTSNYGIRILDIP
jgi:hypothetical protein